MKVRIKQIVSLSIFGAAISLVLFVPLQAQTKRAINRKWDWKTHQRETIASAKKYVISDIEPNLPVSSFSDWFQEVVGDTALVDWDINDCGEQTGTSADRGRDFPMCVGATTQKAPNFHISVNIQFGTFRHGITKMKPVVRSITVGEELGAEWVDNLSDLPRKIESVREHFEQLDPNNGDFQISGEASAAFEEFSVSFRTMDYNAKNQYVPVNQTGTVWSGDRKYVLTDIRLEGTNWSFETATVGGVRFKFDGVATVTKTRGNDEIYGEGVLSGHLTKYVKGKISAETEVVFYHNYMFDCR